MPYIPVQRDEGRILYQSTMDRAKMLGDTLTNLGDTLYQRDEENKAFSAKSSAMKQLMLANKESFFEGLDENAIKQFINGDINKTAKENYLNLATFMEGKITAANLKKQADEIQNSKAERALRFSQAENQQASADRTKIENQAMMNAAKELESINKGSISADASNAKKNTTAFQAPPSGNATLGNISQFLTPSGTPQDPRANFDPRSNPVISAALTAQAGPGPVAVPASVAANYGVAGNAPVSASAGARITPPLNTSDIDQQAKIAQLTEIRNTGKAKPIAVYRNQIIENTLKSNRDARAEEAAVRAQEIANRASEAMTLDQADSKVNELKKQYPDRSFTIKPGTIANSYTLEESVKTDPNIELRKVALQAELKPAQKSLDDISSIAELARNDLPHQERILNALKSNVTTGPGAELSAQGRALLSGTGLINNKDLAKDQVFLADLAIDRLTLTRQLLKGQGSVSVEERNRVDRAAANVQNDPAAIAELMRLHTAATKRSIAAEDYRIMLDEKSNPDNPRRLIDINKAMKKWYQQNTLTDFDKSGSSIFLDQKLKNKE